MILRMLYFFLCMTLCYYKVSSQEVCIEIDSVKCYSVPLDLKTTLSLSEHDIRNFEKKHLVCSTIKETSSLLYFSNLLHEIMQPSSIIDTGTIDSRIVIDIFFKQNFNVITLSIDRFGGIKSGEYILYNEKIIDWLNDVMDTVK